MLPMAEDYLELAHAVDASAVCDRLLDHAADTRREPLDEALTNLWVTRLHALHDAVIQREEEARRIGKAATWVGLALALVALLVALLVARYMARSVSLPLLRTLLADCDVRWTDLWAPPATPSIRRGRSDQDS